MLSLTLIFHDKSFYVPHNRLQLTLIITWLLYSLSENHEEFWLLAACFFAIETMWQVNEARPNGLAFIVCVDADRNFHLLEIVFPSRSNQYQDLVYADSQLTKKYF